MDRTRLLDKTFACSAASAIRDSMGAPVEAWHYTAIREKYGIVDATKRYSGPKVAARIDKAIGIAEKYREPLDAMIGSVNYGRDCDGIAGFAGGLAAALNGSEQVPQDMVKKVNVANGFDLMEMAKRMQGPIMKVMEEKETAVRNLKALNRCLKSYS